MKRYVVIMTVAGLGCAVAGWAQAPASMSAELTQAYTAVKNNIMKTAEKMPEADYSFKPTPDIRAFAEVLDHVADSQMRTCAAINGDQKTAGAAGKMSKADVTAALNDAFAECDKAYGSLSDANAGETIKTPRGQRSKLGALAGNLAHDSEQYGILAMYLRLKGIVPPSSDRSGGR
jgi:DinB superfamily